MVCWKNLSSNYYEKADMMKGMTGTNLMTILESRLDNVIFRLGFARTRKEARQIVDHKFVTVNGKKVNIPSYLSKSWRCDRNRRETQKQPENERRCRSCRWQISTGMA